MRCVSESSQVDRNDVGLLIRSCDDTFHILDVFHHPFSLGKRKAEMGNGKRKSEKVSWERGKWKWVFISV